MKTIFYGLAGEGLGHAVRTMSVIERVKAKICVFTWGEAFNFFEKEQYPFLYPIDGLPFGRNKQNKITALRSVGKFFQFLSKYKSSFNYVAKQAEKLSPSLFVSDFEPILPRVAKTLGIPLLSIDNQHKFSRCSIQSLPFKLRSYAWLMGRFTELFVPDPDEVLVSTFYHKELTSNNAVLTNCFLRQNFENQVIHENDFVLVYYKKSCGDEILKNLSKRHLTVKVYNCPQDKRIYPQFQYYELCNCAFIRDLAQCSHLFCSAGNQLLGEALYFGKPIFAVMEPNQPEQEINAFYIQKLNYGIGCNSVDDAKVDLFLNNSWNKKPTRENGVDVAADIIHKYIRG